MTARPARLAELLVPKRRNGPVGKVDLVFLHHRTKFEFEHTVSPGAFIGS